MFFQSLLSKEFSLKIYFFDMPYFFLIIISCSCVCAGLCAYTYKSIYVCVCGLWIGSLQLRANILVASVWIYSITRQMARYWWGTCHGLMQGQMLSSLLNFGWMNTKEIILQDEHFFLNRKWVTWFFKKFWYAISTL